MNDKQGSLQRYLLKMWYLGSNFRGSQRQPNKRTIEDELIKTLIETGYMVSDVEGNFKTAARTDAGVHAREAAFAFTSSKPFHLRLIETNLPKDMGITSWATIPLDYHPRWEACSKVYHYIYPRLQGDILDVQKITEGLDILKGTHNFRLFSKTDNSKPDKETNFTLDEAKVLIDPQALRFIFRSRSFLWQQIRRMVSFLLEIGRGENSIQDLHAQLNPANFSLPNMHRSHPISPEGLILWSMDFNGDLTFTSHPKLLLKKKDYLEKLLFVSAQKTYSIQSFLEEK